MAPPSTATPRARFAQAVSLMKAHVAEQRLAPPECFLSYAWGTPEHEQWVEKHLATDLDTAGIPVVLDRWDNAGIGASIPRFIERVAKCERVLVIGTPLYRTKYDNNQPMRSFVVAAEGDLIGKRMIGSEAQKESVLPVLLEGTEEASFPPLLQGRVFADFRKPEAYFDTLFHLLLSLYRIPARTPVTGRWREALRPPAPGMREGELPERLAQALQRLCEEVPEVQEGSAPPEKLKAEVIERLAQSLKRLCEQDAELREALLHRTEPLLQQRLLLDEARKNQWGRVLWALNQRSGRVQELVRGRP